LLNIDKNERCASTFCVHPNLNCLGQYYQGYRYIRVSVKHIQTIREYFQPNNKARAFERRCIVAKKGAICPIFDGNMPLKKRTPFSCRRYAALAGVLLKHLFALLLSSDTVKEFTQQLLNRCAFCYSTIGKVSLIVCADIEIYNNNINI
jgi:hypothetical protein